MGWLIRGYSNCYQVAGNTDRNITGLNRCRTVAISEVIQSKIHLLGIVNNGIRIRIKVQCSGVVLHKTMLQIIRIFSICMYDHILWC